MRRECVNLIPIIVLIYKEKNFLKLFYKLDDDEAIEKYTVLQVA